MIDFLKHNSARTIASTADISEMSEVEKIFMMSIPKIPLFQPGFSIIYWKSQSFSLSPFHPLSYAYS